MYEFVESTCFGQGTCTRNFAWSTHQHGRAIIMRRMPISNFSIDFLTFTGCHLSSKACLFFPDGPFLPTSCSTVVKSMPCTQRCACAWGTGAQLCMCKGHWRPSVHVQWNTAQTLKPESPKPETLNWNAATHTHQWAMYMSLDCSRATHGPKP